MVLRCRRLLPLLLLLAPTTPGSGEAPAVLVCSGHEPEWSLRIDASVATLATLGAAGLLQTRFDGRLQETAGRPPSFVYRGSNGAPANDLVAVVTSEACVDTTAGTAEGEGRPYTARVSLPDGTLRTGCCSIPPAAPSPQRALPPRAAAPGAPVPPPAPAGSLPAAGRIAALTLADGRECRAAGPAATAAFGGRRVDFDCGLSLGTRTGLAGPLAAGPEGLVSVRRLTAEWRDREGAPRGTETNEGETTAARVSEIALSDGLTCRFAEAGATLAFEGRRAMYSCGSNRGETVALLGELEPVEGGFRVVRGRIAHGEDGFSLVSSDAILVTAPR